MPVAIGTATRSANGITFGADFEDMSATTKTKQYVQFGIECQNDSGVALEMCQATLKIDVQEA